MRQRFFTFTDSDTTDFWSGFVENQYGTRIALSEIHPETFDEYLQKNNPKLHKRLTEMPKITRKFYVGSRNVVNRSDNWTKATLEAAIAHAKELCEESGEEQIVVQIVRVVRPAKTPMIVEKV